MFHISDDSVASPQGLRFLPPTALNVQRYEKIRQQHCFFQKLTLVRRKEAPQKSTAPPIQPREFFKSNARAAYFFGDNVSTGVEAINALTTGQAQIFNAAGAHIPSLQKGMNIVQKADGTTYKVLVK